MQITINAFRKLKLHFLLSTICKLKLHSYICDMEIITNNTWWWNNLRQ
ncbi:hypothetical protein RCH33_1477 [Flavobacterium daejeonense]|nr:hypothetical protein RCH33_1477 [Flavobacterium daejeonense]